METSRKRLQIKLIQHGSTSINEKFVKKFSSSHVLNHLKTLKKKWKLIQEIKSLSGVAFNEDTYTIGLGQEEYQTYIETHPSREPYLNKPLTCYPDLEKICSNDLASGASQTGLHATSSRSFGAPPAPSSPIEQINVFGVTPEAVQDGASEVVLGAHSTSGDRRVNNSFLLHQRNVRKWMMRMNNFAHK